VNEPITPEILAGAVRNIEAYLYNQALGGSRTGSSGGLQDADLHIVLAQFSRLTRELGEARARLRDPNAIARQLADKADELAALQQRFDDFADTCSGHSADRVVEQVAADDEINGLTAALDRLGVRANEMAAAGTRFRAERDRLHDALREILSGYWEHGHPGYDAVRTYWLKTDRVQRWRDILAATPRSEVEVAPDVPQCEFCGGPCTCQPGPFTVEHED
jgi:hypothetical protein